MQISFGVLMFFLGAVIGSFLCCQVRRLELLFSKKKTLGPRSVCMSCKKKLNWYENIPLFSWLFQGGKCRKCKAKIGCGEILAEFGIAAAFACTSTTVDVANASTIDWMRFATLVIFVTSLGFLAIYDGIYGELPNFALIISASLALAVVLAYHYNAFSWGVMLDALFAISILGGIYLFLYLISGGKWVGDGDWLLGSIIAVAIGKPWLALIVLFLSNLIACLVMYPLVKNKSKKQLYFGPFLVIAYIIVLTFSEFLEGLVI